MSKIADWRDEFGKRHRKVMPSQEGAALLEAKMRESVREAKSALRSIRHAELHTTRAALDVYLASVSVSARTRAHLQTRLGYFVERSGQSQLHQVTPTLVAAWLKERSAALAPTTLARDAGDLARWFRWLLKEGYVLADPTRDLELQEPPPAPPHVLSYAEEAKIIPSLSDRTFFRFLQALDAGLRRGQTVALRANHYDRQERTLTVRSNKPPYQTPISCPAPRVWRASWTPPAKV